MEQHILSLSYGKDSLACLGAIEKLGWPLDRIVHAEVWATDTIPADLPPIPEPFVASPEACQNAGEYIVDDADIILQKLLGGKVAMATVADDLNSNEEYLKYLTGRTQ